MAHPASVGDAGDAVSIPRSGRSPGGGNDNSLVFFPGESHGQRNVVATVHGVAKSQTHMND